MAKPRIIRLAESWAPQPGDAFGEDKGRLIDFLVEHSITSANPRPIEWVLDHCDFSREYTRTQFQHRLLGPLRRDDRVFVGWCDGGIFIILRPEDVETAVAAYTTRIRAEMRHVRGLRVLSKRARLMDGYVTQLDPGRDRATIYFDESGNPDINDLNPPVFVVAAVLVDSRQTLAGLDGRFRNAFNAIGRPEDHELKSAALSVRKHVRVLRELSLLDYEWAAVCFHKTRLTADGFQSPVTFYRYAYQFLVGDLLTVCSRADLVLDQYSSDASQQSLEEHLRSINSGLPVSRLGAVTFADSSKDRLVQLADLVAGAVRLAATGIAQPLREIEERGISLVHWPRSQT